MLIGYARVSTLYQNLDMQIDALQAAGCEKIFTEKISGKFSERPALDQCLDYLRNDHDVLVVWKLDRLGRSLTHLVSVINGLSERNIGFKTVQGNLDTESSFGKMLFYIMAAFAEFERDLEQERTMCGLESA